MILYIVACCYEEIYTFTCIFKEKTEIVVMHVYVGAIVYGKTIFSKF